MLSKLSIRVRMTLLSVLLLLLCCLGLTTVLNFSANRMADVVQSATITPAIPFVGSDGMEATVPHTIPASNISTIARKTFFNQSVVWTILIVSLGGSLTYFMTGRALRPLQELSEQMKNRTVHNLSETIPLPKSQDELTSLTSSFNHMTGKLDEAFAMQKRFSQSAAHELRTPLTVMKTKLDVFRKKPNRTQEEYDALFNGMEVQTERLSSLVKELLDLTCMDAAECKDSIDLPLLSDIVQELSNIKEAQKLTLTLDCPACQIRGSRNLLHRAFYNLLENAMKYNVIGGRVSINVLQSEKEIIITVSDTGIGIPKEQRTLIYEPFYRVDQSRSRQMGGAGLGLSTVKQILDLHGAQIAVQENPGGGSIFAVTLLKEM